MSSDVPGSPFAATRRTDGPTTTVLVAGELDMATCPELERVLRTADGNGCRTLVLDLAGMTFIDSTGVRLIIEADARAREAGRAFVVASPGPQARQVFDLTGLSERLRMTPEAPGAA